MKRTVPLLLLALGAIPASAQTGLLVPTSTGRPDPRVLSLREMAVDVGVARGVARVNVRQVFENHTGEVQEGTWRFRLSPSGAVGDFAVWDGLVRIPGVIVEKKRARAIYEELTTRRIDPGLLQQGEEEDPAAGGQRPSGGAVFSVKVAPIPAWGTKRLEMQYQEEVPWADGIGEIRIPLRPGEGEPTSAGSLEVTVTLEDGTFLDPPTSALPLAVAGKTARFRASDVPLAKDIVVRMRPASSEALSFSAFRSPDGRLPDGLALAPWERLSDAPPEKDGFFLLEQRPATKTAAQDAAHPPARKPLSVALLFDTSLSTRWGSLETGWAFVNRLLARLGPADRFVAVPFDSVPIIDPAGLLPATDTTKNAALTFLRARLLAPGTQAAEAVRAAAALLPNDASARLVLVTDGAEAPGDLARAAQGRPLFTVLTGEERREAFPAASRQVLPLPPGSASQPPAGEALFLAQLFADLPRAETMPRAKVELPFAVKGGDPGLRDVYGVMTQPPLAGSLSGWVGRYGKPAKTTISLASATVPAAFPERALEARDLPRRWARARVDDLLRRIELEGEKREWIEEILELSRRYKFVTPYTAFLAAPRSLLRPRRIQPGDPILRIEALPGTAAVAALLPFGRKLDLTKRNDSNLWEGRFLVPEGTTDGPMNVRIVLRDRGGATAVETKRVVVDGTPPTITPVLPGDATAGARVTLAARADADVIVLTARVGDGLPVPLRWDGPAKANVGDLLLPQGVTGSVPVFFEAIDGAGNHGFARATLRIR